jgi:hypothetical protein
VITTEVQKKDPRSRVFFLCFLTLTDLEVFVSLDTAGADLDASPADLFGESNPLEVGILAAVTTRIELCGANAVGIPSRHTGSFFADDADIA